MPLRHLGTTVAVCPTVRDNELPSAGGTGVWALLGLTHVEKICFRCNDALKFCLYYEINFNIFCDGKAYFCCQQEENTLIKLFFFLQGALMKPCVGKSAVLDAGRM